MTSLRTRILRLAAGVGCLLTVPLLAMRYTDEVVWGLGDFVVAGALLFGAGLSYELAVRTARTVAYRAAVALAAGGALLLVWTTLAVGIIGSEDEPANLLYAGVLAVGGIGAFLSRLEPRGMARALLATALAQAIVPAVAFGVFRPRIDSVDDLWGLLVSLAGNACFAIVFLGSALLFRHAAHQNDAALRPEAR